MMLSQQNQKVELIFLNYYPFFGSYLMQKFSQFLLSIIIFLNIQEKFNFKNFIFNETLESDQYYIFFHHFSLLQEVVTKDQRISRCSSKIAVLAINDIGNAQVVLIEFDQMQVFNKITIDQIIHNNKIHVNKESNKFGNSLKKKNSLFKEYLEIFDGEKPFKIFQLCKNQQRQEDRSYLLNPYCKQIMIRYDILIGFIKKMIDDNLHILLNFDKYLERQTI
ncbi:unnamed protein product [Paramecium sonneborni]|uniref:Uncharacterized protein n=1 Tax=Paramecium sonneborni TaxID=65129 RepID=A0A8S1PRA2_9CILI|nr:unnamed protein product [Paramecium sonneborni]